MTDRKTLHKAALKEFIRAQEHVLELAERGMYETALRALATATKNYKSKLAQITGKPN